MKAFIVNRYGKKEKLQLTEIAEPVVKETDILVQVYSAGVNLLDAKIRDGEFKMILPYTTPFILGHDVSGVVTKAGSNVSKFKVGDEVYARPADHRIGTFAELIAMNEKDVALKPKNLSMVEAASIPLVGLTAWQALVEKANLKKGQKVFIQAGSGGVGTFAIQLAKHLGATVATTTSTANIDLVKSLGADIIIDYKKEDFEIILKFLSAGIRRKAKRLGVNYSFLFMRSQGEQLGQITKLIESGIIKPVMDKVFPFEQTNEAMAYVEKGRAKGKVVVRVR